MKAPAQSQADKIGVNFIKAITMKNWLYFFIVSIALWGFSLVHADSSKHSGNVGAITAVDLSALKIQIDGKDFILDDHLKVYNAEALSSRLILNVGQKVEYWKKEKFTQSSQPPEIIITKIRLINPVQENPS